MASVPFAVHEERIRSLAMLDASVQRTGLAHCVDYIDNVIRPRIEIHV